MRIKNLTENTLKISLTAYEISLLFGSYENIDYRDEKSKRILGEILKEANVELESTQNKLYIEVVPDTLGGCSIYCTCVSVSIKSRHRLYCRRNDLCAVCYSISSDNSLLTAIEIILSKKNSAHYTAYKTPSNYILITDDIQNAEYHLMLTELSDSFRRIDTATLSVILEHSQEIWKN